MRGGLILALCCAWLDGCKRETPPPPPAPPSAITFEHCDPCECCIEGKVPSYEVVGKTSCHTCMVETNLRAYGIAYKSADHFGAGNAFVHGVSSSKLDLGLSTHHPVSLTLPPGTRAFGVTVSERSDWWTKDCSLRLVSAHEQLDVTAGKPQLLSATGEASLDWVRLEVTCPQRLNGGITVSELWLSPGRAPVWPSPPANAPTYVDPLALPPPKRDGKRLVWDPPLRLAHGPTESSFALAQRVLQAPVVIEGVGLRANKDVLVAWSPFGDGMRFQQHLIAQDNDYEVRDAHGVRRDVTVSLADNGLLLQYVDYSGFEAGLELPTGPHLSRAQAVRIAKEHKFRTTTAGLRAANGKVLAYIFDEGCELRFVDVLTGKLSVQSLHCIIR